MYEYLNAHGDPPIPIPRCIYGEKITGENTGILILEFVEGVQMKLMK